MAATVAQTRHPGKTGALLTLLATLIARDLRCDPADPHWPDRDRLLLTTPVPGAPPDAAVLQAPPGLALAAAVGQAIAERLLAARFGRSLVDHRVWLVAGPADLLCGTGWEAATIAGALGLGRLTVLASLPRDDKVLRATFAASGWSVRAAEAHDRHGGETLLSACQRAHKPTLILTIGVDLPAEHPPAPNPRGAAARRAWLKRLRRHASREAFQQGLAGHMPPGWIKACQPDAKPPQPGAAAAVTAALGRLSALLPQMANLPLSTAPALPPPPIAPFAAGALSWEALDLAAPACLLGMSLHGGIVPISQAPASTSLPRAAWQLAAEARARWLHMIAQDAPAPPLAKLGIANLHVFQPAHTAEALDCLALALGRPDGPTVMVMPCAQPGALPGEAERDASPHAPRLCTRGAYLVHAPPTRDLTLLAAGAGLALALAVRSKLMEHGLSAAVVSMPCRALFDAQDSAYRQSVLGAAPLMAFAADALAFAGLTGAADLIIGQESWPPDAQASVAAILRHMRAT